MLQGAQLKFLARSQVPVGGALTDKSLPTLSRQLEARKTPLATCWYIMPYLARIAGPVSQLVVSELGGAYLAARTCCNTFTRVADFGNGHQSIESIATAEPPLPSSQRGNPAQHVSMGAQTHIHTSDTRVTYKNRKRAITDWPAQRVS